MRQMIYPMKEQYEEFLTDESKFCGYAESISFPENEEEIREILLELKKNQIPVTIQGGKTGITGGAVPQGGHIMNLSHMNKVKDSVLLEDGTGRIIVEPGINLIDLKKEIAARFRKSPVFWPAEPTESSATAGGIAATNAQGISRLLYGDSREYIEGLSFIDSEGKTVKVKKGQTLLLPSGREIEGIDAAFGKEGITGVITELTLKLIPKPESIWGIAFFFCDRENAGRFIDLLKESMPKCKNAAAAAVEYLDRRTITMIEEHKPSMTKIRELPDVGEDIKAMVYVEIHGEETEIEVIAEGLMETAIECSSDPDQAWAVSGEGDVEKMHAFRHIAAEASNLYVEKMRQRDQRITKLGTDMEIFDVSFTETLSGIEKELEGAGLKGCVFGHALENHLHVNLLPESYEEYEAGIRLIQRWASEVNSHGGKIIGEHGIGKLKLRILEGFLQKSYVDFCRELKRELDPCSLWNNGNIFKKGEDSV